MTVWLSDRKSPQIHVLHAELFNEIVPIQCESIMRYQFQSRYIVLFSVKASGTIVAMVRQLNIFLQVLWYVKKNIHQIQTYIYIPVKKILTRILQVNYIKMDTWWQHFNIHVKEHRSAKSLHTEWPN